MPIKEITKTKNLPLEFTCHAQKRIQQRGLTKEIVQFIFDNGLKTNSHKGLRGYPEMLPHQQRSRASQISYVSQSLLVYFDVVAALFIPYYSLKRTTIITFVGRGATGRSPKQCNYSKPN